MSFVEVVRNLSGIEPKKSNECPGPFVSQEANGDYITWPGGPQYYRTEEWWHLMSDGFCYDAEGPPIRDSLIINWLNDIISSNDQKGDLSI